VSRKSRSIAREIEIPDGDSKTRKKYEQTSGNVLFSSYPILKFEFAVF